MFPRKLLIMSIFAGLLCIGQPVTAAPPATPQGPPPELVKQAEATMQKIIKALEGNKMSADALIATAREAGANPKALEKMEKLSQAFRQTFLSTVSPQQIIDNLISQAIQPQAPGSIIITGPDGSQWLVTPNAQQPPVPPQQGPKFATPPPPGAPKAFTPPPPGAVKPFTPPPPPDFQAPAPQGAPQAPGQSATPPPPPPAPTEATVEGGMPDMVIIEEQYLPYWPTKDDLGKDGVLKYLEKRQKAGAMDK